MGATISCVQRGDEYCEPVPMQVASDFTDDPSDEGGDIWDVEICLATDPLFGAALTRPSTIPPLVLPEPQPNLVLLVDDGNCRGRARHTRAGRKFRRRFAAVSRRGRAEGAPTRG